MLIARENPILQVTHAHGGQCKYNGHLINFAHDIKRIASLLPCGIEKLNVLIIWCLHGQIHYYDCYVSRNHIRDVLEYKVKNDPYYNDISISVEYLSKIHEARTKISSMLHTIEINEEIMLPNNEIHIEEDQTKRNTTYTSSSMGKMSSKWCELKISKQTLYLEDNTNDIIDLPKIDSSLINEYNIEGFLDMAFPTPPKWIHAIHATMT